MRIKETAVIKQIFHKMRMYCVHRQHISGPKRNKVLQPLDLKIQFYILQLTQIIEKSIYHSHFLQLSATIWKVINLKNKFKIKIKIQPSL